MATTFVFVSFVWIFFRAPDFGSAWDVIGRLVAFDGSGQAISAVSVWLLLLAGVAHAIASTDKPGRWTNRISDPVYALGLGVVFALSIALVPVGTRPFIYFQF